MASSSSIQHSAPATKARVRRPSKTGVVGVVGDVSGSDPQTHALPLMSLETALRDDAAYGIDPSVIFSKARNWAQGINKIRWMFNALKVKKKVEEQHMARKDSLDSVIGAPDSVLGAPPTTKTLS